MPGIGIGISPVLGSYAPKPAFNPLSLNPALVLDSLRGVFSDLAMTTPAGVGDPVAAWADQSGNGRHATQSVFSKRPAPSAGVVQFDGVDDSLATSAIAPPPEFSIVASMPPLDVSGPTQGLWEWAVDSYYPFVLSQASSGVICYYFDLGYRFFITPTPGESSVHTLTYSQGNWRVYVNEAVVADCPGGRLSDDPNSQIRLGKGYPTNGPFKCRHFMLFETALTPAQIAKIVQALP